MEILRPCHPLARATLGMLVFSLPLAAQAPLSLGSGDRFSTRVDYSNFWVEQTLAGGPRSIPARRQGVPNRRRLRVTLQNLVRRGSGGVDSRGRKWISGLACV